MFNTALLQLNTLFVMSKDFDRLMLAARTIHKCETPADAARFLDVSDQVMTNWKARGLPQERILLLAKKIGCNPFWLESGEGIMEMAYAKTMCEARVLTAMQKMKGEDVATVVKSVIRLLNTPSRLETSLDNVIYLSFPINIAIQEVSNELNIDPEIIIYICDFLHTV